MAVGVCANRKREVKLDEIFSFSSEKGLLCKTCCEAKVASEFSEGTMWTEWKLDYLKRHIQQKSHLNAVGIIRRRKMGMGIGTLLQESAKDREKRNELSHKKKSDPEQVKILIDNILLAIKMNASMLSVQQIHDHMAKYVSIPEGWRSKNYAFEFVNSINEMQNETMCNVKNAPWHTLIVDESTDITVHKMLVLYIKYREENDVNYKTVFGGIIQLTACTAHDIHRLDLQRMVMLTSDGASVMLGKHNRVAALLKRKIPHLTEQHCVAHREDLGIDDAWKDVPLMRDVETLLRTVYSTFSRSTVKRGKMEDLAKILDEDTLSFRPLSEVRWLSRHQAVNAVLRNYTVLEEYCKRDNRDPVAIYCYKKLRDSKFKVTLTALGDVLGELAQLCLSFQRRNLTVMEGHCFARAKIKKLRSQYLNDEKDVQWSDRVKEVMRTSSADARNTGEITLFIRKLCDHLDARFPEDELKEWSAFDIEALSSDISFEYGSTDITTLAKKYEAILHHPHSMEAINSEYSEFKYIVKQKLKQGSISTFSDMVAAALRCEELKEISQLVDICATFQASSADFERGFSLMNHIKTASRNRLEVAHLDQLMCIKSKQEADGAINLDKVYNHWRSEKDRREK
ncbi:putative zinc finger protein 862-like [Triplophysa rosa]|uniref:Zinc finger protein 862-like n=1 Tax=Triplophysa rosa TaxID=992332 RepID=A0A9W7T2U9_TRIRA|nr:putative zinc finger protein 862-like [Triplophysa rosa]